MKPYATMAVAVFALIAVAHLLRLLFSLEVIVAGFVIPAWWSVGGIAVAGFLALMVWREARA